MKQLIIAFLAIICLTSCGSSHDEPEIVTTPRTVLVYMVANNSLGSASGTGFDKLDLNEMEIAARNGDLGKSRWIVYHHPRKGVPELKELTPEGFVTLKNYDTSSLSVSASRMNEVIADMKAVAPAADYGLVLWSHASGWIADGITEARAEIEPTPLSFGDDGGNRMDITTLRDVLAGKGFSYIYADCCNMATVETAYELRSVAKTLVGSATELPARGMPYDKNLRHLVAAQPDLVAAARNTFDTYNNSGDPSDWCTISVINLEAMDGLADATREVYRSSEYPADYQPQRLGTSPVYYYDFKHFVDAMSPGATSWNSALAKAVVYQAAMPRFSTIHIDQHCGLATYILFKKGDETTKGYNLSSWYNEVAVHQPLKY